MAARLATAALSAFTVAAAPATLVKLTASYPNTKCLDGSDYGIYVRPGQGAHANSWLINFEGTRTTVNPAVYPALILGNHQKATLLYSM